MRFLPKIIWRQPGGLTECPYFRRTVIDFGLFSIRIHEWYSDDDHRAYHDRHGTVWHGEVGPGVDGFGKARQFWVGQGMDSLVDFEMVGRGSARQSRARRYQAWHSRAAYGAAGSGMDFVFNAARRVRAWYGQARPGWDWYGAVFPFVNLACLGKAVQGEAGQGKAMVWYGRASRSKASPGEATLGDARHVRVRLGRARQGF